MHIGLSRDLLSGDLLMHVGLSRDLLVDVGLSWDLEVEVGLGGWGDLASVVQGVDDWASNGGAGSITDGATSNGGGSDGGAGSVADGTTSDGWGSQGWSSKGWASKSWGSDGWGGSVGTDGSWGSNGWGSSGDGSGASIGQATPVVAGIATIADVSRSINGGEGSKSSNKSLHFGGWNELLSVLE